MKLTKLICSNCKAQLDVDIDNLLAFCPYCGQKLLFDMDQMEYVLAEKEKTKRAQERTKRIQMEYEYKEREEKRDSRQARNALFLFLAFIIVALMCLAVSNSLNIRKHTQNDEVKVSTSAVDFRNKNYIDVQKIIEKDGFLNIELLPNEDLILGWLTKDGSVESISIDGRDDFSSGTWFSKDAIVRIVYHTFPSSNDGDKQDLTKDNDTASGENSPLDNQENTHFKTTSDKNNASKKIL